MKPTFGIWALALLLGLSAVYEAAADPQRRRDRRKARRADEVEQQQPATASEASVKATSISTLGMFVFPAAGQNPEQQAADEAECWTWAEAQTGGAAAAETVPPAGEPAEKSRRDERKELRTGAALKGAAKGAVIGEALEDDEPELGDNLKRHPVGVNPRNPRSEVGDNVKGALKEEDEPSKAEVGAAVGAVAGRRKAKKGQEMAEQQAAAAQKEAAAAEVTAENEELRKAVGVCLEAKGYKVG